MTTDDTQRETALDELTKLAQELYLGYGAESDTPISDAALRYSAGEAVPLHVSQEFERKANSRKAEIESLYARIDQLNMELSLDLRGDALKIAIEVLRASNDKLYAELTNERMLRYDAEAKRNAETERCAKIAREFTLSPVVGKAIAALIMEGK